MLLYVLPFSLFVLARSREINQQSIFRHGAILSSSSDHASMYWSKYTIEMCIWTKSLIWEYSFISTRLRNVNQYQKKITYAQRLSEKLYARFDVCGFRKLAIYLFNSCRHLNLLCSYQVDEELAELWFSKFWIWSLVIVYWWLKDIVENYWRFFQESNLCAQIEIFSNSSPFFSFILLELYFFMKSFRHTFFVSLMQ